VIQYFEDLHVGQKFRAGPLPVSREQIIAFAREFDPQPMHLSEEQSVGTLAGELIASGWHTGALTMRLLIDGACPNLGGKGIGAGVEQLTWPNPVRPGDALSAESEILDLRRSRSNPTRAVMKIRTVTTRQDGAVVQTITAAMIIPCRSSGDGDISMTDKLR
jgi:acyl dehydratase